MSTLVQFDAHSPFYTRVEDAPLDPRSALMAEDFATRIRGGYSMPDKRSETQAFQITINTGNYNAAYVEATNDDPYAEIMMTPGKPEYSICRSEAGFLGMRHIPAHAQPSPGADSSLLIYHREQDTLTEIWKAEKLSDTAWTASWGGTIRQVSQSPGVHAPFLGVSASGTSLAGGAITKSDVLNGKINHALYIGLPYIRRPENYNSPLPWISYPANRTDGRVLSSMAPLMGQRFRLPTQLQHQHYTNTRLGRMIFQALQTYGAVVSDTTIGSAALHTEHLGEGNDDFWGEHSEETPYYRLMEKWPWDRMEWITPNYGRNLNDITG